MPKKKVNYKDKTIAVGIYQAITTVWTNLIDDFHNKVKLFLSIETLLIGFYASVTYLFINESEDQYRFFALLISFWGGIISVLWFIMATWYQMSLFNVTERLSNIEIKAEFIVTPFTEALGFFSPKGKRGIFHRFARRLNSIMFVSLVLTFFWLFILVSVVIQTNF